MPQENPELFPEPDAELHPRPEQVERPKPPREQPDAGLFREFRRLLARRELLDGYFASLARALRFNGQVRLEFHDGRVVWSECREKWVDWSALQRLFDENDE